jgi:hypothetical protein
MHCYTISAVVNYLSKLVLSSVGHGLCAPVDSFSAVVTEFEIYLPNHKSPSWDPFFRHDPIHLSLSLSEIKYLSIFGFLKLYLFNEVFKAKFCSHFLSSLVNLQHTMCGYEVPGMILSQASYPYTYSLLRGVTFEAPPPPPPFSSCAPSLTLLLQLETFFLELLLNSFQCRHFFFFYVFSILKSSSLYGRLYFWKQPEVLRSQIRGIGWGVPFQ